MTEPSKSEAVVGFEPEQLAGFRIGVTADRRSGDLIAALERRGAEVLHAPREWPEYHPGYYGVFLRDLDRHNVEAVHHGW